MRGMATAAEHPRADFDLVHWIEVAQLAENAKFDSLFLAHGPADGHRRIPLLTALAQHTQRIGLIATVSSTYNEPCNLARRLASLDHVSGGRAGSNIVTSSTPEEDANFEPDNRFDHASHYVRADEFLNVAKALWDSWECEALLGDKASGRYADVARLHTIDHYPMQIRPRATACSLEVSTTFGRAPIPSEWRHDRGRRPRPLRRRTPNGGVRCWVRWQAR